MSYKFDAYKAEERRAGRLLVTALVAAAFSVVGNGRAGWGGV